MTVVRLELYGARQVPAWNDALSRNGPVILTVRRVITYDYFPRRFPSIFRRNERAQRAEYRV